MRKIDHCQSNDPVNWSALQSDSPACLATSERFADWPVSLLRDFASLCRKHQFTDRYLVFTGQPFASPAYIDPAFFPQYFAQDLNPKLAASLNAAQRPINAPILGTPSGPVAWHTLRSWYAVSGADLIIDPAEQRWMASRAGATIIEFPDASHAGGFTHYATG